MDRDLVEKLLTAQVLTLAAAMKTQKAIAQPSVQDTGDGVSGAIAAIRRRQAEIIRDLLASPPADPGTAGS